MLLSQALAHLKQFLANISPSLPFISMASLAKKLNKRRQTKFSTRYVKSVGMSSKGKKVSPSSCLWFIKGTPPTSNLAQRKL